MSYWSITILLLSVTFLAYKRSGSSLTPWLRSEKDRSPEKSHDEDAKAKATSGGPEDGEPVESEVEIEVAEPAEAESTPKAAAKEPEIPIPTFSLDEDTAQKNMMPPPPKRPVSSFLAANSAQRASAMPPPARPASASTQNSTAGLMPPPPRPSPNSAAGLRVPSTGPLPNRGIPSNSQQRVGGGLAPTTTVATPNARGKVLLSPGHSPMDWAALTRSQNLSGVSTFQRVTPSTLKTMTGRKGKPAWSSWQGKVYNITPYLDFHPGGRAELMKAAGRDGTKLFMEVHPWVNWENMLGTCLVGVMVPEDLGMGTGESSLEDMD